MLCFEHAFQNGIWSIGLHYFPFKFRIVSGEGRERIARRIIFTDFIGYFQIDFSDILSLRNIVQMLSTKRPKVNTWDLIIFISPNYTFKLIRSGKIALAPILVLYAVQAEWWIA